MCYGIAQMIKPRELEEHFAAHFENAELYRPSYYASAFNRPFIPVITNEETSTIRLLQWGLIPSWIKDAQVAKEISLKTINARSESVFDKPAFRQAIEERRCLVLVSGFFEWREINGKKYPYYIWLKNRTSFALAGIWDTWKNYRTGNVERTFSVLTTQANRLLAQIHNVKRRMPVIISKEKEMLWLTRNLSRFEVAAVLKPYDDGGMSAHPVSRVINRLTVERLDARVIQEHYYPELPPLLTTHARTYG